jgi:hypothetical protein
MSTLDEMKVPEEIVEAIQASLPDGQVIRQVGLLFSTWGKPGNLSLADETFVAVTDKLIAFRKMGRGRALDSKQLPVWLPEIISSSDILISEFTIMRYAEVKPTHSLAMRFKLRGHQIDLYGFFEYSAYGSTETLCSFFDDVRKINDHIRNVKLGVQSSLQSVSRDPKCASCGSTELTVQGGYAVCDFCQTKYAK